MVAKRIIPCLDVKGGKTVKGVQFGNLVDVGDPVELAVGYNRQGADELVFLDIAAGDEGRGILIDLVKRVAEQLSIPFTVGGGIRSVTDAGDLLNAGADKISINSAAVKNPGLINEIARAFGSQCLVIAIDSRQVEKVDKVFIQGGKVETSLETLRWADEVVERGAGEILLTSMDRDGTRSGFAVELTKVISQRVRVPVIASGGAGSLLHFQEVFQSGDADAALAAGLFHRGELSVGAVKNYLREFVEVRYE